MVLKQLLENCLFASEVGVGAVLSQRADEDDRLHPCTFLSRRLSAAVKNYDVGGCELLAVKLAMEEWRHWLEGTKRLLWSGPTTRTLPTSRQLKG